jgi:hypothetical protein
MMIQPIRIFDNFYSNDELGFIFFEGLMNYFNISCQPGEVYYQNPSHAYPCHETKKFDDKTLVYHTLIKKLNPLFDNKIKTLTTFFRKTLRSEILENKSQFKSDAPLRHQDLDADFAGLIYITNLSIMDGTKLFTVNKDQWEPDIVIGAKPNRMIVYNSNIWHEPNFDKNIESRFIQPFFIKLEKENEI